MVRRFAARPDELIHQGVFGFMSINKQPSRAVTNLLALAIFVMGWQALVTIGDFDRFILPAPIDVAEQFGVVIEDGRLLKHTLVTLSEVLAGVLIGCTMAATLGYLLAKSPLAERLLSPYLIASQAIPVIAIAPLLSIWIQSTYWSRVLVAVLVVFFPILVNVIVGVRSVSAESHQLMKALGASRLQTFLKLELPAALPVLLGGLRIGATLSIIGALVGEFVQPRNEGLGYLLVTARYQFKTPLVFVILVTLAALALTLYSLVYLLEKRLLHYKTQN